MKEILEKIYNYSLEEIMGQRFGRYSKYIIQDRAIPDVRDGLKPVQRRIIYSMYTENNTYDKGYRKSAKTVGDVIGNYHPHGDTSIYEAMVRMSQEWKVKNPYIIMHGNNGSIDGDSAAAYRYTEAKLSKISNELINNIKKETVKFAPNFDDTRLEPTVLPARYPNLLVNGTTGISAGYATNIPPHNLGEIIDATIKRIESPNCHLDTILEIVKGPDFPTGGVALGIDGIRQAFETGRGKVIVKSKTEFIEDKKSLALIITEIPYEVNKALLVRKMDEIRIDKKIDGILEVRDESDREGLRISIDLKKDANKELVLNYLLKNTDLQVAYNYNMIAIMNRRPKLLGIIGIIDAYIAHLKEVTIKSTEFDLAHAKARFHIVEGLIKCLSILDKVIKVIRESSNKTNAKDNLVKEFAFSDIQAEAIVMLQLYKLTNTDVVLLEEELASLTKIVADLTTILNDPKVLEKVMKDGLKQIKNEYNVPRMTKIVDELEDLKIDTTVMIPKENVVVLVTKDGYVKRSSLRSYNSTEEPTIKENDYILNFYEATTLDTLLLFTNLGNYLYVPVYEIPDIKWKEIGKHISNMIKLEENEEIINCLLVNDFNLDKEILSISKLGMIKRTKLCDFKLVRYSKQVVCLKLKENDLMIDSFLVDKNEIFITTNNGYGLWFDINEVPIVGLKATGVKGINLKNDFVVGIANFNIADEYIAVITNKGTGKRIKLSEFSKTTRAKRGIQLIRDVKTNPYKIINTFISDSKNYIGIKNSIIKEIKLTELSINDRSSTGNVISKENINSAFIIVKKINKVFDDNEVINVPLEKEIKEEPQKIIKKEEVNLKDIDKRLMTIDDFLDF
ncbi:MAG: DNA topoisomerase IV subunit A [Bacilli bacterium]